MKRWVLWFAFTLAHSGCGKADLGGDTKPPPDGAGPPDGSPASTDERGDLVFGADDSAGHAQVLAIAGDDLYFPLQHGNGIGFNTQLIRCKKTNCAETMQAVYETPNTIDTLQVFGDRLGIAERAENSTILTCALPDCSDRFRLDGLRYGVGGCWFEADSVEWSQTNDNAVYRCALPGCDGGPQLLFAGISAIQILRSDEVTILSDAGTVWRIAGKHSAPERLELGAESRTLGSLGAEISGDPEVAVGGVAVDGDWLYAMDRTGCETVSGFCAVARWPLRGYGPRQVIFEGNRPIPGFSVHRGELAALTYGVDADPWNATEISVCRTDACSETRRDLLAAGWTSALTSDDERWYWVWNSDLPGKMEIRSTPRLDAP